MGNLRDSEKEKRDLIKGKLDAIWGELQDVSENYAQSYIEWCLRKLLNNKKHISEMKYKKEKRKTSDHALQEEYQKEINKVKHKNIPKNISPGDVVHVTFGVNIADELSDIDKHDNIIEGHYAVVLEQKGFMFLVIPLTSQNQRVEPNMIIKDFGLPGTTTESHVAFAKMKTVHIRRINRVHGIPEGKKTLDPDVFIELKNKLREFWGLKV